MKPNSSKNAKYKSGIFSRLAQYLNSTTGKYLSVFILVSLLSFFLYYIHFQIGYQSVSLIFLFLISLLPLMNYRPGQIFFAAVLSAFVWNFFFIPPYYTLRIGKVEDTMMFGMYFIIASVSGLLISRIKTQQLIINAREVKTNALYNLAKELSSAKSLEDVVGCAVVQLKTTFSAEIVFMLHNNE